ncbi:MAG: hypothetical protein ACP5IM_06800 [Candidatus Bathyarchaeia archaeon]
MKELKVKGALDAEERAKRLVLEKHSKATHIQIKRMDKMDNSWLIEGEFRFKRLHLFTAKKLFKAEIDAENGEAKSYIEWPASVKKES